MKTPNWVYFVIAGFIIIAGVVFAIFFGMQPRPVPKISWSHFHTPEEFGENIYKRLRQEVNQESLFFLGVDANKKEHLQVWISFLNSMDPGFKIEKIVVDSSLAFKNEIPNAEVISIQNDTPNVITGISEIVKSKKRVAIIGPTQFFSYLVKNNFQNLLRSTTYPEIKEKYFNVNWLTFSLSGFPLNRDEEKNVIIPCDTSPKDEEGTGELGCLILMKARANYRKVKKPQFYSGMLDQVGSKEYLALFGNKNP